MRGLFAEDDSGRAGVETRLDAVARDPSQPAIVRASALARLRRHLGATARGAAVAAVADPNPLVRRGALEAVEGLPPGDRLRVAVPLLADSLRAVRVRAAWLLAPVADALTAPADRAAFDRARAEFEASQRYNGDRAESRVTLGAFAFTLGDTAGAETEFRWVVDHWPRHISGWTNLAGILALRGRDAEGEAMLRTALRLIGDDADLRYHLGLSLARQSRRAAAAELERARRLAPRDPAIARALTALSALRP